MIILITYNLILLSTDIQWDMASAIGICSSIEICSGTFKENRKSLIKSTVILTLLLVLSSILMCFIGCFIYTIDAGCLVVMLILELGTFIPSGINGIFGSWLDIEHQSVCLVILLLCSYTLRLTVSLVVGGNYGLSLGLASGSILRMTGVLFLYKRTVKKYRGEKYVLYHQ